MLINFNFSQNPPYTPLLWSYRHTGNRHVALPHPRTASTQFCTAKTAIPRFIYIIFQYFKWYAAAPTVCLRWLANAFSQKYVGN